MDGRFKSQMQELNTAAKPVIIKMTPMDIPSRMTVTMPADGPSGAADIDHSMRTQITLNSRVQRMTKAEKNWTAIRAQFRLFKRWHPARTTNGVTRTWIVAPVR